MATDATGTPTSPDNIPTFNTSADAPSGLGFNAAMASIQSALALRMKGTGTPALGNIPVWNNATSLWTLDGSIKAAVGGLAPGNNGDVLQTSGGAVGWGTVSNVLNRATTGVDVQASPTETDLYNFSVAGNTITATKMLRLTMFGDYLHNNVAGDTCVLRIYFGGTKFFDKTMSFSAVLGAARQPWHGVVAIANLNATNSQMISGTWAQTEANAGAPTTGIGTVGGAGSVNDLGPLGISTLAAIDTTAAAVVRVSVQWSASSANNSYRMRYAVLELV